MKKVVVRIARLPSERLVRIACYVGIVALLLMSWSALVPAALPIVIGMSLGQALGVVAFLFYVLAILYEMRIKARPEPAGEAAREVTRDAAMDVSDRAEGDDEAPAEPSPAPDGAERTDDDDAASGRG